MLQTQEMGRTHDRQTVGLTDKPSKASETALNKPVAANNDTKPAGATNETEAPKRLSKGTQRNPHSTSPSP